MAGNRFTILKANLSRHEKRIYPLQFVWLIREIYDGKEYREYKELLKVSKFIRVKQRFINET